MSGIISTEYGTMQILNNGLSYVSTMYKTGDMAMFLPYFILIPILGFLVNILIPKKNETVISWVAFTTVGLHMLTAAGFIVFWLLQHYPTLNLPGWAIYQTPKYSFFLSFYFDKVTATYLIVGAIILFQVIAYSRYYLHRKKAINGSSTRFFYFIWGTTLPFFPATWKHFLPGGKCLVSLPFY